MNKQEFASCLAAIREETGKKDYEVIDQVLELEQIAKRIGRRAIRQCNEPLTDKQNERIERVDAKDYARADELAGQIGLEPVQRQSDARGFAIKLMLPKTGRYNSMGGLEAGWGIG